MHLGHWNAGIVVEAASVVQGMEAVAASLVQDMEVAIQCQHLSQRHGQHFKFLLPNVQLSQT